MPSKLVHFIKYKTFFLFFYQTFFWYMSKMYLWVLTLATKSEPTLIGQLALSLQTISILDVASSSIALWVRLAWWAGLYSLYEISMNFFGILSHLWNSFWMKWGWTLRDNNLCSCPTENSSSKFASGVKLVTIREWLSHLTNTLLVSGLF